MIVQPLFLIDKPGLSVSFLLRINVMQRSIIQLIWFFGLLSMAIPAQSQVLDYTYKARNLKPQDFKIDASSWEKVIALQKDILQDAPDDLDALYIKAIAHREIGIRRALFLRKMDWEKSTSDFEAIINRDSSYQDVLFQYGLLQQYKRNFEKGIELLHRHQQINQADGYIEAALFRMYRYFVSDRSPSMDEDMPDHGSPEYNLYFKAEMLRLKGELDTAHALFLDVLSSRSSMPVQPILLSMARIKYAGGEPELAQSYVYRAIDRIESEVDARMFFEDFKYIFSDAEVEAYKAAEEVNEYKTFFHNFLAKRNPTKAADIDARLQVHYQRLSTAESLYTQYAPREAFRVIKNTEPFQTADRDFPKAYWLNGELGDRGLIYVRHGEPDDKAASVSNDTPYIESWRYYNPDFVFHFEGHSGLGVLIPILPTDLDALEAREVWGGPYALLAQTLRRRQTQAGTSLSRSADLDIISYNNELFDRSLEDVNSGLSTDRFVWPGKFSHIDITYMVSAFKGTDNRTDVDVHFSLPLGQIAQSLGRTNGHVGVDVGLAVHDTTWNTIYKNLDTRSAPLSDLVNTSAIDLVHFKAEPDTYNVNLHVSIDEALRKGSYLFGYRVPAFRPGELSLSDIIPAVNVSPTTRTGRYIKNGLHIQANPGRGFRRSDPLFVYFEIYNLTFSPEDKTVYSVEYTLESYSETNRRRLFGKRKSLALSISFEREGEEGSPVEYGELDVSSVRKGVYILRVTITDKVSNISTSNYRIIELSK